MEMNPLVAGLIRGMSRLHTQLYRLLGGRGFVNNHTLLLTTRGRKTGREVTIPLLHVADGDRFYVVGSFGGNDRPPHWYLNLLAHPEVEVEAGGRTRRCRARTLDEAEKNAVWPRLLAIYPAYASYQGRTARVIPVIELAPVA